MQTESRKLASCTIILAQKNEQNEQIYGCREKRLYSESSMEKAAFMRYLERTYQNWAMEHDGNMDLDIRIPFF